MNQPWWGSRDPLALSISEAARICGVKRRTIRRRHQAGEFEHAFKDADDTWRIPVNDLVAAGLRPNVVTDPDEPRIVFSAASQVDRLRTEVAVLRERVRALEIIAREREERVTDLRTILRMLPAAGEVVEATTPRAEERPPLEFEADEEPLAKEMTQERGYEEPRVPMTPSEPSPAEETAASAVGVIAPPAASTEPIVILPDAPSSEAEPYDGALEQSEELLETARQRSAELLEDAMSLWWPSPAGGRQPEVPQPTSGRSGPASVTPSGSDAAKASPTVSDRAAAGVTVADQPPAVPSPDEPSPASAPRQPAQGESDLFLRHPADEASFDWLDRDFGRPPRHLRRRLGRFFRRHRRPR